MMSKIGEKIKSYWELIFIKTIKFSVQFKKWFLSLSWDRQLAFVVFVGLLVYVPVFFFSKKDLVDTEDTKKKLVEVRSVGELSDSASPLSLVGIVESVSEATVRAEGSGQLVRVYKKVGDRVYAGETIATFENSSERAGVTQAEGAYEQAKAAREISNLNNSTSGNTLDSARTNALNSISSSYISMDDAIHSKVDLAFTNPREANPTLNILFPDQALQFKIESGRAQIEQMLNKRSEKNKTLSVNSDLSFELSQTLVELNLIKSFLDDLAKAYSIAIPNQSFSQSSLDANKAVVGGLRSAVSGNISSVTATRLALIQAETGNKISGGDKSPSQASLDATVKIALGSYQAALARLNKTIVRSSISGTVNSISVKTGDYATPGQTIAIVSNNNALLVTTSITPEDAKKVSVGQEVSVNGRIQGIVTRVASAIDPLTKKIKVEIGFKNDVKELTNGDSVRLEIKGLKQENKVKSLSESIKLPLSAIKMTPRGTFVFSVVEGKLVAREISIGNLSGNEVEVVSGLFETDVIVKDARGLKEGQEVEIK